MLRLIQGEGMRESCGFCGTITEKHTPACQQDWRDSILAYPTPVKMELNFNTVVYSPGQHTFSTMCPQGCHGQLEECYYKQEHTHTNG